MALSNAERQAKTLYLRAVQQSLAAQGQESKLDQADYAVVEAGAQYGVGPYDCAAQIMANRSDAREGLD